MFKSNSELIITCMEPMKVEDFIKLWETGEYFREIDFRIPTDGSGMGTTSRTIEGLFPKVVLTGKGVRMWITPQTIRIEKDGDKVEFSVEDVFKFMKENF